MSRTIKRILTAITLISSLTMTQLLAIDGYKTLKFEMTKKQAIATKICNLNNTGGSSASQNKLFCFDLIFGKEKVEAELNFIDDRLMRVSLKVALELANGIVNELLVKYGSISSRPSQEEIDALEHYPNRKADLKFDNDTVIMRFETDNRGNQKLLLMYSRADYEGLLIAKHVNKVNDDLLTITEQF